MAKKKIILIIIDGLGDRPLSGLRNKTPLEAAKTPNLDWLAKKGICGQVLPFLFPGEKIPTSEGAHIGLLGYKDYFLGRGVYEVAGIGMRLKKGDIALRVNFGTVDENLKIIDRRAGRIEKTQSLIKALSGMEIEGVKFLIKKSYGHRAGLILRCLKCKFKHKLSPRITDNDPKKTGVRPLQIWAKDRSKNSKFTAKVLNEFLEKAHQILEKHPLNKKRKKEGLLSASYLLVRGASSFKKVPSFKQRYGLGAGCIAGGGLYKGIAKILGMTLIEVKGANGLPSTNLKGKISAVKKNLKKPAPHRTRSGAGYDFIFLHIKAADSLAEDGNYLGKKKFIEKIDKNLKPLLSLKNTLIVVTSDHSTCCDLKKHCQEPIPILIYGAGADEVSRFSEKACRKGKLGKFSQLKMMSRILRLTPLSGVDRE